MIMKNRLVQNAICLFTSFYFVYLKSHILTLTNNDIMARKADTKIFSHSQEHHKIEKVKYFGTLFSNVYTCIY